MDFTKDVNPTFPPPEPYELPTCHPKELVPIEASGAEAAGHPNLPSPPRKSLLDAWFSLSTHLVPCASPRTTPDIPLPPLPKWSPNKDEFKASVKKTAETILDVKEQQWRGELDHLPRGRKPMWNCVNRYVRKPHASGSDPADGLTLFCAHANGFPKEVGEKLVLDAIKSILTPFVDLGARLAASRCDARGSSQVRHQRGMALGGKKPRRRGARQPRPT